MITQTIQTTLTQRQLDPIVMRAEESGREIQFVLLDESEEPIDLTGLSIKFMMIKPDQNVIYADLVSGVLQQTEQMAAASGLGYYALRVMDDDQIIYTGQGQVIIDDHLIDDATLESISEVDGLIFPDDFLTTETPVAIIDDLVTNSGKTWSSSKISESIADAMDELIDDNDETSTKTWSSQKIYAEIGNGMAELLDDQTTDSSTTWSSAKIADELSNIDTKQTYSTTEHIVGKWIDGRNVYEKTVDCGSMPITSKNVPHGVSNPAIIWLENGFFYDSVSGYSGAFNLASNSLGSQANVWISGTDIEIWTGTDRSNCDKVYVTIRYIKGV